MEIETEMPELPYPHLYEMLALQDGVRMFRPDLHGAFDELSDGELLNLIRVAYWDGQPCVDAAARIESARMAINCALNRGAKDFVTRLMACSRN